MRVVASLRESNFIIDEGQKESLPERKEWSVQELGRRWRGSAFGKAEQDLAASFYDRALALPGAQQTAHGEQREARGGGQILVGNLDLKTAWHLLADVAGEPKQYCSKPLPGRAAIQSRVEIKIPLNVVGSDGQGIVH